MKRDYEPTPHENEHLLHLALAAAYRALAPLNDEKAGHSAWVRACLNAFNAANRAIDEGRQRLLTEHPDCDYCSFYHELDHIVASAVWSISTGAEIDSVHPYSQSGSNILALIHAAKVLDGIEHLQYLVETVTVDGCQELAESFERLIETALTES